MDSDNIFEGLKENKKTLIIAFVLILILFAVSIFDLFGGNNEEDIDMKGIMKSFAQIYYEEHYYPEIKKTFGDQYAERLDVDSESGIKMTLREIVGVFDEVDSTQFYQEGNYCDYVDTYAIIYPEEPYKIDDYKIEVQVSCEK